MKLIVGLFSFQWLRFLDFLAPVAIRVLLAPLLWISGVQRLGLFSSADFSLYNPLTWINKPVFQANADQLGQALAGSSLAEVATNLQPEQWLMLFGGIEVGAAALIAVGLATRWAALGSMVVLSVFGILALGNADPLETLRKLALDSGFVTLENSQLKFFMAYPALLLSLFFTGAGRWFSLDWYICRGFHRDQEIARPLPTPATAPRMANAAPSDPV